jgi:hypothetical protein
MATLGAFKESLELAFKGVFKNADEAAKFFKTGAGDDLFKAMQQGEGVQYLAKNPEKYGDLANNKAFKDAVQSLDGKLDEIAEGVAKKSKTLHIATDELDTLAKQFDAPPPPPKPTTGTTTPAEAGTKVTTTISEGTSTAGSGGLKVDFNPKTPPTVPASVAGATDETAALQRQVTEAQKVAEAATAKTTALEAKVQAQEVKTLVTQGKMGNFGGGGKTLAARLQHSQEAVTKTEKQIAKIKELPEEAAKLRKEAADLTTSNPKQAAKLEKEALAKEAKYADPKTQEKLADLEKTLAKHQAAVDDGIKVLSKGDKIRSATVHDIKEGFGTLFTKGSFWKGAGEIAAAPLNSAGRFAKGLTGWNQFDGAGENLFRFVRNAAILTTGGLFLDSRFNKGRVTTFIGGLLENCSPLLRDAIKNVGVTAFNATLTFQDGVRESTTNIALGVMKGHYKDQGKNMTPEEEEEFKKYFKGLTGDKFAALEIFTGKKVHAQDLTALMDAKLKGDDQKASEIMTQIEARSTAENKGLLEKGKDALIKQTEELAATVKKEASDLTGGFNLAAMMPDVDQNSFLFKIVGSIMSMVTTFIAAVQPFFTNPMSSFAKLKEGAENGNVVASKSNNPAHERIVFDRDSLGPVLTGPEFA